MKITKKIKFLLVFTISMLFANSSNAQEVENTKNYDQGFKLGIGGVVTYKTSTLPEVLKQISLEHIVLETDSPYLPPVPFRGKRNESSYIIYVAKKLAEIYETTIDEIAKITTENSKVIFKV